MLRAERQPIAKTTEQQIRGGDRSADWVLLVSGHEEGVVEAAGNELRLALAARECRVDPAALIYAPAFSLAAKEIQP